MTQPNIEELRKAIEALQRDIDETDPTIDKTVIVFHGDLTKCVHAAEAYLHSQEKQKKWTAEELRQLLPILEQATWDGDWQRLADAINKGKP